MDDKELSALLTKRALDAGHTDDREAVLLANELIIISLDGLSQHDRIVLLSAALAGVLLGPLPEGN